jgi:hypothetical protein
VDSILTRLGRATNNLIGYTVYKKCAVFADHIILVI